MRLVLSNEELLFERMVSMGSNIVTFHLTGEDTGGHFSLTEFIMAAPPAPGPPMHIHGFEKFWEEMANLLKLSVGMPDPANVLSLQEKYHMDAGGQARKV